MNLKIYIKTNNKNIPELSENEFFFPLKLFILKTFPKNSLK